MTLKSSSSFSKPTSNRTVQEKLGMEEPAEPGQSRKRKSSDDGNRSKKSDHHHKHKDRKREKKSAADRREELLKQLKAVENAIAKKRTKMGE